MTPRDSEQVDREIDSLWRKTDTIASDIQLLREDRARLDGKLDALISSLNTLVAQSNCKVHADRISSAIKKITELEVKTVQASEFLEFKKSIDRLRYGLVSIGLLVLAQIIQVIFQRVG